MLQAGAIQVCITPPVGVELSGYGPRLNRRAVDIHDDLTAQALVLDDGETRFALLTCDLIALSESLVGQVRHEVAARTRIDAPHVIVACIHSHTAPTAQPFRDWGRPDRAYVRHVGRVMAGAVVAAEGRLKPAQLRVGRGEHAALAWNRTGSGLVDDTLKVLRLDGTDGQTIAILVNYACHPVMLGPKPVISADYPGAMRRHLSARRGGAVVMFANGACGDVDPASNRHVWGQATFDDVDAAGRALAESADAALDSAEPVDRVRLENRTAAVTLDYAMPAEEELRARIDALESEARAPGDHAEDFKEVTGEVRMPRFWLRYYRALQKRIAAGRQPASATMPLQALVVGDEVALIAIPAEVFTEQGLAIRARSPFAHTFVVCYANGTFGYLPPRAEYERGGYTAGIAAAVYDAPPYTADVADRLVEAAGRLLARADAPVRA